MDASKLIFFVFVFLICTIIAAIVKNRQRYFLFLLVFFAPFSVGLIFRHENGIFLMDFPLLLLLIYGILSEHRFRFYFKYPAIGLIIWGLLTGIHAERMDLVISELSRVIRAYLAFLCVSNFTRSKKDIITVTNALLSGLAFQSMLGALQWRWGYLGLTFLNESHFAWRAAGTFIHPAMFGDYLMLLIPLVFRLFIFYKPEKKYFTAAYGVLFVVSTVSLLASYARGPWLSFAGAMTIMLLFSLFRRRFHPKFISATALMVLFGTIFAIQYTPTIVSQFTDEYRKGSAGVRMPLNKVALRIIQDNLVFGTGLGNYDLVTYRYVNKSDITEEVSYRDLQQIVHNSYLLVTAEAGIPGCIFFVWFLASIFKTGWKVLKIRNSYISNMGIGLLTGILALLIAFMAGPDYGQHQILMIFWIVAGYLVTLSTVKAVPQKSLSIIREEKKSLSRANLMTKDAPTYP